MKIKTEKTIHFAEHEVYIPFNADSEAVAFNEWWGRFGSKEFEKFYMENRSDYEF